MSTTKTIYQETKGLSPQELEAAIADFMSEDSVKSGTAAVMLWDSYEKYIISVLRKNYSTYFLKNPEDTISECKVTFFESLADYDPSKGTSFTTFIQPRLKHTMSNYIGRMNNQSQYYSQNVRKIQKCIDSLNEKGIEPSLAMIAEKTGIALSTIKTCMSMIDNSEIHMESSEFLEENLTDKKLTPEEETIMRLEMLYISKAMAKLTPIQRYVIEMKFGFTEKGAKSQTKIAEDLHMKLSEEKKIYRKAIEIMREFLIKEGAFTKDMIKQEKRKASDIITFIDDVNTINKEILRFTEDIEQIEIPF